MKYEIFEELFELAGELQRDDTFLVYSQMVFHGIMGTLTLIPG